MRILAIDPGVVTGFSMTPHDGQPHVWQTNFGELSPDSPHVAFHDHLAKLALDIIVCERFDFRQNKRGVDYTPVIYIGVVKSFCQTTGTPLYFQGQDVKSKKGFWSDQKLKFLGLYVPGLTHAMDALKHRLYFELRNGMFDLHRLRDIS